MSRGRAILLAAAALVLLLAVAQLVLPRIAAARIRSRIARYGIVQSVQVSAWPAIKLLWGSVDSVRVRAGDLSLAASSAESLLWEARHSATISFSARSVRIGRLHVTDVQLSKHGAQLDAHALASAAAVHEALPGGVAVKLLRSEAGEVEARVDGSLFGLGAAIDVIASSHAGALVVRPAAGLFGALQLTLFSDPHVYVEGVGASERGDPPSYGLSISALLR